ncbi:peptidase [Klebsiella variicola]
MQLIREPVPESLTEETPRPALDEPVTWGGVAIFSDRLNDALDSCNADKAAIRQWDAHRQNTQQEP